jgi:hypothetical protein
MTNINGSIHAVDKNVVFRIGIRNSTVGHAIKRFLLHHTSIDANDSYWSHMRVPQEILDAYNTSKL